MLGVLGPGALPVGPEFIFGGTSTLATSATTDSYECIFRTREPVTITQLGCAISARTGTPPTYEINLQGVNTSTGRADGTIKSSTNAKATFTPPADTTWNNTFQWFTLTSSYTCSRGELLAIVVKYSSGTINASNRTTFRTRNVGLLANFPYLFEVPGGVATLRANFPVIGYRSATVTFGMPLMSTLATPYNSDSTPDEKGTKFTLPANIQTYSVIGARLYFGPASAAATTATLLLYDTDGSSVLESVTLNQAVNGSVTTGAAHLFFDTAVACLGGSAYRLTVRADNTTTACSVSQALFGSAQDQIAMTGDVPLIATSRTDAGAWTDDATTVAAVLPIIDTLSNNVVIPLP